MVYVIFKPSPCPTSTGELAETDGLLPDDTDGEEVKT